MDSNTSNLITNLVTGFFSFFTNIYQSAKHRKLACCGCCSVDVEMKDDKK